MGFGREDVVRPKKREWGWDSREMKPAHTKKPDAGSTTKLLWNLLD